MATSEATPLLVFGAEDRAYDSFTVINISDCGSLTSPSATANREHQVEVSISPEKMSDLKTIMTIIKGNIGTGVLAMPFAISCAGLVVGPILLLLMGFIALFCIHLLVRSSRIQQQRVKEEGVCEVNVTYAEVTGWTLQTAHPSLRGWPTKLGKRFVNFLLMTSQLGFCSIYIVFVAQNTKEALDNMTSKILPIWVYQLGVAVPLLLYSQIKELKRLSPCLTIANFLTIISLAILFINFFSGHLPDVSERPAFAGWSRIPIFFGTVVFSFEGISLVLPLEKQVRDKQLYTAPAGMLTLSLTLVVSLCTAMGFFGFLAYGPHTMASITLNLPYSPWYYFSVRPAFALVIFLSYNLQLYVPVRITIDWLTARYSWEGEERKRTRDKAEAIVRALFLLITLAMGMVIPKLDLLISFIGAFASSFLAFILPAVIYLMTVLTEAERPRVVTIVFLVFIIAVGLLGFVVGTYTAVLDIVHAVV